MERRTFILKSGLVLGSIALTSCLPSVKEKPKVNVIAAGTIPLDLLNRFVSSYHISTFNYYAVDVLKDQTKVVDGISFYEYKRKFNKYKDHPNISAPGVCLKNWEFNKDNLQPLFELSGRTVILTSLGWETGTYVTKGLVNEILRNNKRENIKIFCSTPFSLEGSVCNPLAQKTVLELKELGISTSLFDGDYFYKSTKGQPGMGKPSYFLTRLSDDFYHNLRDWLLRQAK